MAQWSAKRMEMEREAEQKRKAEKLAGVIAERLAIFRRFRDAGWEVRPVEPGDRQFAFLADNIVRTEIHFRVKMPGAYPMRIRSMDQIRRLVKGAV